MLSGRAGRQTRDPVRGRIAMLNMEADILSKSISRLYEHDSGLSAKQEGLLISKYQAQLRSARTEVERLEGSLVRPDLGPLRDGIAKLVDSRFSALDERMHELSSKMDAISAERRRPEPQRPEREQRPAPETERRPEEARPEAPARASGGTAQAAADTTDESEDDIDELRKRIMTTLKKLDQAEVE